MIQLKSIKITIPVEIEPGLLSDPEKAINKKLSSYLLKYSNKIEGIPVSFIIRGVTPTGIISSDTGSVIVTTLVEYIILNISIGDIMNSTRGMILGVFYVTIDGNDEYDGNFIVKKIISRGKSSFTILGDSIQ